MPTEFFNFGNDETFHFFKWICGNPAGPDALVRDAFRAAETPGEDEFPGEDICYAVRNRLRAKLEEILWNAAPDADSDTSGLEIGDVWLDSSGRPKADALWLPILSLALARIDCQTVAEALLVRVGRWNPSKELPEAE
jgi:hypothetical protein